MNELFSSLLSQARASAAKRQIPFDFTVEQFERLVNKADGRCQVTGIPFSWGCTGYGNRRPYAPSLDRIDSRKGYTAGNVRLVIVAANLAMNTWGEKVLIRMAKAICGDEEARAPEKKDAASDECEAPAEEKEEAKPRYLSRAEAAEYINGLGLPITKNTLQKMATVGGGPSYRRFGMRAVYTSNDLDAWVTLKMSKPMASTSSV